jgi:serine phosphatase RsbU (regulator of sigma subunit)
MTSPTAGWSSTNVVTLLTSGQGRPVALVMTLCIAACYLWLGERFWQPLRHTVFDTYQWALPRAVTQLPAIIVAIDDASLAAFGQWPWPRTRLARLIRATQQLGALVVGLDMVMPEADRTSPEVFIAERSDLSPALRQALVQLPSNDAIMADAMRQGPTVIGRVGLLTPQPDTLPAVTGHTAVQLHGDVSLAQLPTYSGQLVSVPPIETAASGRGYLNTTPDADGIVRATPLLVRVHGQLVPTFALELLRVAAGVDWYRVHGSAHGVHGVQIGSDFLPTDLDGRIRLYYSPVDPRRSISALAVLHGTVDARLLNNHVAIIGVTGVGVGDAVATPIARLMYGAEVQAQIIENLLGAIRLVRPPAAPWIELGAFAAVAVVLILFIPRVRLVGNLLLIFGAIAIFVGGSLLGFIHARFLIDPSFPAAGSMVLLATLWMARFAVLDRNRRELEAALNAERLEMARIAGELRAAHDIQMGMVPTPGTIEGLPDTIDFYAVLEPAEEVGGDLYDAFMLDAHRFFFMIGDVAGKGVPASLFMALSKTLCKNAALRTQIPLHELMMLVNTELSRENPADLFVTLVSGLLDTRTGTLELCNAGHGAPILLRHATAPYPLETPGGPPLCVLEDFVYVTDRVQLQLGDLVLLVTDGVTEAQNPDQTMYGLERVLAHTAAISQGSRTLPPAATVCHQLYADIKRFRADAPVSDDVTIVAIRFARPANRHTPM